MVLAIIMLIVGLIAGYMITVRSISPAGALKIVDNPDSNSPLLFLELNSEVEDLYDKRYVTMKVRDLRGKSLK